MLVLAVEVSQSAASPTMSNPVESWLKYLGWAERRGREFIWRWGGGKNLYYLIFFLRQVFFFFLNVAYRGLYYKSSENVKNNHWQDENVWGVIQPRKNNIKCQWEKNTHWTHFVVIINKIKWNNAKMVCRLAISEENISRDMIKTIQSSTKKKPLCADYPLLPPRPPTYSSSSEQISCVTAFIGLLVSRRRGTNDWWSL